jgi:hypothetical protein
MNQQPIVDGTQEAEHARLNGFQVSVHIALGRPRLD